MWTTPSPYYPNTKEHTVLDKALSVYLENKFKLYPKYPSMIARRRLELEYKDEVDESLLTSKSNYGNHEEEKRIKINILMK